MTKALHGGPWFIMGHFPLVRNWDPNFMSAVSKIQTTTIWIQLPQLPMEFYDKEILEKEGTRVGNFLKIDTCTSSTLRGRLARIYIQVPIEVPFRRTWRLKTIGSRSSTRGRVSCARSVGEQATYQGDVLQNHHMRHQRRQKHPRRGQPLKKTATGRWWNSQGKHGGREQQRSATISGNKG